MGAARAEQARVTADRLSQLAQGHRSRSGCPQPALGTLPFDVLRIREVQNGRGLRHRQAPQTSIGCGRLEKSQALLATGAPVLCGFGIVHLLYLCTQGHRVVVHLAQSRLHCGHRAAQTYKQIITDLFCCRVAHPSTGVQGHWLSAPAVQQVQRIFLRQARTHERGFSRSDGQHLEADFGDHTQGAPTARHEAADVIAGHVLHDLTAKGQVLAQAIDESGAQNIVSDRTHRGACGPTEARSDHAAHGRAASKMRGLKRQALALVGQRGLQLRQRCAATGRDHQLAGLVTHDAAVGSGVEYFTTESFARKVLAATAAQT